MTKRRRKWLVFGILAFIAFCIAFMTIIVNPVVAAAARSKVETLTTKAVNRAISNVVNVSTYRELTDIRYDNAGKITSVSTNSLQMNGLAMDIASISQNFLEIYAAQGISVPLGTFSGIPILTGFGPNVGLRVVPVGSVHCDFDSQFVGQGINQTIHRIVLKVRTLINLIMPLNSFHVTAEVEVLLCESIIVGEVPEIYLTK